MIELQIHRHPSLTEARTPCTLLFDGRRPAKLHHSLHGASSLGQAELNLSQLSPQIRAPRHSRVRAHFLVALSATALGCALTLSGVAPLRAQAQKQAPPARPGAPQPPLMRPVTPQVTIESSPQLFATMCALWAAGYYTGSGSGDLPTAWKSVADEMAHHQGPVTDDLHEYLGKHQSADRAATLSRFISFGLVVGPPPSFSYTFHHEELPPDVLTIEDFNPLLVKFYKEARVDEAWKRVEPSYVNGIAQLQGPITQIVQKTMGYLREVFNSDSPRTFTVYVEPLAGVSTNFRAYGDAYSIVLNGENVSLSDLRYAFLHFLLDPLPAKFPGAVMPARAIMISAARAPRLPREFRDDITGFYAECLIKAVEIQLDRMSPGQRERAMDAADAEGFVLVRPLAAQLVKFQQDDPAMSYYFPDLSKGVDLAAELKRVQAIQFSPAVQPAPVSADAADAAERDRMLQSGERLLTAQDGPGAQAVFEKVLERWPGTPRATYGLALAAAFQNQKDRAKDLFVSLTQPSVSGAVADPEILSMSHIYLGRIHDGECDREKAVAEYRAALAVPGLPERARQAAQKGIDKEYVPKQAEGDPCAQKNP
ncbi:MAG: hypothetical protein WAM91_04975 [Candidatus Acidiferrales bacterium]